jgi:hypothetical protein
MSQSITKVAPLRCLLCFGFFEGGSRGCCLAWCGLGPLARVACRVPCIPGDGVELVGVEAKIPSSLPPSSDRDLLFRVFALCSDAILAMISPASAVCLLCCLGAVACRLGRVLLDFHTCVVPIFKNRSSCFFQAATSSWC